MATTWEAAYPYTQKIEGQNVRLEAYPYDPYSGSPMSGITKVYLNNKFLYSIDRYYRERIFTSEDGSYLVVVRTSNSSGVASYTSFGIERVNFDQTAIEVYKNGISLREFTLKDVVDTTKLISNGKFFYWGYYFLDYNAFDDAISNCEFWDEELSRKEKKKCLDGDTAYYCSEWINGCDSAKIFKENFIGYNSVFVKDNSLFILTNQKMVVKLDFRELLLNKIPIDQIITDKNLFAPPKLIRKYKKVKLPDKFDEPTLKDGRSFEKGLADCFDLGIPKGNEKYRFCIFINNLIIDRNGNCIKFYGWVYDRRISAAFSEESIDEEMSEKLRSWIMMQNSKLT